MEQDIIAAKNPLDYLKIIFKHKWILIIPTLIGIIGGIMAANLLPKVYEASTLMLVEEGRVINPLIQGLAVSTSVAQRLSVLREQILGWDRINQLITKLNLAKDARSQEDFEKLVKRLRENIRVRLRGANIVGISYQGKDPTESMDIVKTITDIFIAENLRQQATETDNAIAFINDQLELYQKKLKQGEVAQMEDQLNKLLVDSTDKHPLVKEYRQKIAAAQEEIEKGNYQLDESAVAGSAEELTSLKGELKSLREELTKPEPGQEGGANRTKLNTTTNDKLYKLLLLERIDNVTQRDAGVNQTLYNELLKRLETAKITRRLEASTDGTRYTILDPARLPLKPVKPNKILTLFIGMFLGLSAGLGVIFALQIFDHSFLGVDDAKAYLELPVLGAISKIVTQADVKAQKLRNVRITAASVVTGIALLAVIIFNIILGG